MFMQRTSTQYMSFVSMKLASLVGCFLGATLCESHASCQISASTENTALESEVENVMFLQPPSRKADLRPTHSRTFVVKDNAFWKDGSEFILKSASMHYFRIHPDYWRDRIQRVKALGVNCITTYVPWNFHEEEEGHFDFSPAWRNVTRFVELVHEEGLLMLFRPGPYVCAEWEMGGLPAWLLRKPGIGLRTFETQYIRAVTAWWSVLLPKFKRYLYSAGGPIVMVQLENEYGYVGDCRNNPDDAKYMNHLLNLSYELLGSDVIYSTVDNAFFLYGGSPWYNDARVVATVDGPMSNQLVYSGAFLMQQSFNAHGNSPKMWSELWTGWFTAWRQNAHNNTAKDYGFGLWSMGMLGASFSMYMGHGGTNFGFWSGANSQTTTGSLIPEYLPDVTSYDYLSPVAENGDNQIGMDGGNIYVQVRDAIINGWASWLPWDPISNTSAGPPPISRASYGTISLPEVAPLFENIEALATCNAAVNSSGLFPTMEALGQNYGFILYVSGHTSFDQGTISFSPETLHDRVQVFVNSSEVGAAYRMDNSILSFPSGSQMKILVENMGRTNFGKEVYDYKGLMQAPPVAGNWTARCLPLKSDHVTRLPFALNRSSIQGPSFFRGYLSVPGEPHDTYIDSRGLKKGVLWINGFNVGRYWETAGPQHTLYVPAPLLRSGQNEVIVLELHPEPGAFEVQSVKDPRWTPAR